MAGSPGPQDPTGNPGLLLGTSPDGGMPDVAVITGSVATADTDGTRLFSGTSSACVNRVCEVRTGPFVLTDAAALDGYHRTYFYTVPSTSACTACPTTWPFTPADPLVAVSAYFVSGGSSGYYLEPNLAARISGARYYIPADKRLCACGSLMFLSAGTWAPWNISWSGFVPYQ